MHCELCGKDTDLFTAVVEGSQMQVCSKCGKHGKVLNKVRPVPKRKIIVKQEQAPIERIVDDYSQRIRTAREKQELTQKDFALRITVKESLLHKMETGHFEPSIELAQKLERLLHIKLIEIREDTAEYLPKTEKSSGMTIGDMIKMKR